MQISDVRIKLVGQAQGRLQAYCSVTFDNEFVVRDLKVIRGPQGLFVAMPCRRPSVRCSGCLVRVDARGRFCTYCGVRIEQDGRGVDPGDTPRVGNDIAHPINAACRARLEAAVLAAYDCELTRETAQPVR